jgi:hypothetical protein
MTEIMSEVYPKHLLLLAQRVEECDHSITPGDWDKPY